MSVDLWTERYRPRTLNEYVWRDHNMRTKVEEMIAEGALPNLLFSGPPGIGKTTMAKLLLRMLNIPNGDILTINASRERKIEDIQDRIGGFSNTWALGDSGIKYILLDECLAKSEKIRMADGASCALSDLEDFVPHNVKSFNMVTGEIEDDVAYVISRKEDVVFEIELKDGRTVLASNNHPFLLLDGETGAVFQRNLRDIKEGNYIVVMGDVPTAEVRGIHLVGRQDVVNLNVERNHTFITENGIPSHNCDSISMPAQKMLRADMETYADITRIIATCNYRQRIIPALHSRFQEFQFQTLSTDESTVRLVEVLEAENVAFDYDTLLAFVKATYPDMRKCLNLAQQKTVGGRLTLPGQGEESTKDYLLSVVDLFKNNKFMEARRIILEQAQVEEYPELYRFLYKNLELFGDTQDRKDDALLIIRNALYKHALITDVEINLAATLVELTRIAEVETTT